MAGLGSKWPSWGPKWMSFCIKKNNYLPLYGVFTQTVLICSYLRPYKPISGQIEAQNYHLNYLLTLSYHSKGDQ